MRDLCRELSILHHTEVACGATEEGGLLSWIIFIMVGNVNKMLYNKKGSQNRLSNAVHHVLLGNLGSWQSCECCFSTYYPLKHCRPHISLQTLFYKHLWNMKESKVLSCPQSSHDLSLIQHLWNVLDKKVQSVDLKDLLIISWYRISQDTLRGLASVGQSFRFCCWSVHITQYINI